MRTLTILTIVATLFALGLTAVGLQRGRREWIAPLGFTLMAGSYLVPRPLVRQICWLLGVIVVVGGLIVAEAARAALEAPTR